MNGEERREEILRRLQQANKPLSATTLGKALGVSRQVIVQDVALLRAQKKMEILSTYQGYVLQSGDRGCKRIFRVRHSADRTREELQEIVDLGGRVEDVFVFHRVYGVVRAELHIASRRDVQSFLERLAEGSSAPLMCLTDDYHCHTVTADQEEILDQIQSRLEALRLLASPSV